MSAPFTEHADDQRRAEQAAYEREHGDTASVRNDRDELVPAIDYLHEVLFPQLKRVTKSSEEDPTFTVVWQPTHGPERHYTLGGTAKLRSPSALSDLVAEATEEYPTSIREAKAKRIATALRKLAALDDTGSSPQQQTRAWITAFIGASLGGGRLNLDDGDDRATACTDKLDVFTTTDGHLYLRAQELDKYLRTSLRISTTTLSYTDLCLRLRAIGFKRKAVTAPRTEGQQPQRKYWVSPTGYDHQADD